MSVEESSPLGSAASFHRFGVVGQTGYSDLGPVLDRLTAFANERGIQLFLEEDLKGAFDGDWPVLDLEAERVDLLLALGGDGTLLAGARMVARMDIPVLGVNLGHLGFLASLAEDELEEGLTQLLDGDFTLDRRFTLEATVISGDGQETDRFLALNDMVVHKGGAARITRLDLFIGTDGEEDEIGSFSGDGVIVATPTGSTAYSLSADGPIIDPSMECIVVTPICPHTLAVRPLVVPAGDRITIRALKRYETLFLTVDGQVGRELSADDTVVVQRGEAQIQLIRFPGQTFFSTLRRKLNWAVRSEGEI